MRLALADEPGLPSPTKEALYRVAQEALHNAAKHARARSLELVLEVGGTLEITSAPGAGTRLSVRVPLAARA